MDFIELILANSDRSTTCSSPTHEIKSAPTMNTEDTFIGTSVELGLAVVPKLENKAPPTHLSLSARAHVRDKTREKMEKMILYGL